MYRTNLHLTDEEYALLERVRQRLRRGTYCRLAAVALAEFVVRETQDESGVGTKAERAAKVQARLRELLELYRSRVGLRSRVAPHDVPMELNAVDTALIDAARGATRQPTISGESSTESEAEGENARALSRSAFLFLAWKQQAVHDASRPSLPPSFEEMLAFARAYHDKSLVVDEHTD